MVNQNHRCRIVNGLYRCNHLSICPVVKSAGSFIKVKKFSLLVERMGDADALPLACLPTHLVPQPHLYSPQARITA
jgi:hypothetical protein